LAVSACDGTDNPLELDLGTEEPEVVADAAPEIEGEAPILPSCGDAACNGQETCASCPEDCGQCCGDAACDQATESCQSCPADCGQCCGDGQCTLDFGEDCAQCPADCGPCPPVCGDEECNGEEDCAACPEDCGDCCGNEACEADLGEDCAACPEDCGDCCGNEACEADLGEDCATCDLDCGPCVAECGNQECEPGETCAACPADCGSCDDVCGDQACTGEETCESCADDCGPCIPSCGNDLCEPELGESFANCPADCDCDANALCEGEETCENCPEDCGPCVAECGNKICEAALGETCADCPIDCGGCPAECGDGETQKDKGEECDDGGTAPGDGCGADCLVEPMPAAPGDVIITEIMKNPEAVADAAGEWFELYNATAGEIDLNAWEIEDKDGEHHRIFTSGGLTIASHAYAVLGIAASGDANGGVPVLYQYSGFTLSNTSDEVILFSGAVVVDQVYYNETTFPNKAGKALSLDPAALSATANDKGESWCAAPGTFGKGDGGSPAQANPQCKPPVVCGDNACGEGEGCNTCPQDCGPCCPNQKCEAAFGETCQTCTADCGPCCPNAVCNEDFGETCQSCPADCGFCCGNGLCEAALGETCTSCLPDCGYCPAVCGNGKIEGGEPCDDGNKVDGDGCSAACLKELGTSPVPGMIIITEVMKDPKKVGDLAGEWFEITNLCTATLDLGGWQIKDGGTDSHLIAAGKLSIGPGEIRVLGVNADPAKNGGITVDYQYAGFTLANSADEVILASPNGTVIDNVAYDNVDFPDTPGSALSLEPTMYDGNQNDLGVNWCTSPAALASGDFGSPGKVNPSCAAGAKCGNGKLEWGEECDDGNVKGCDGCDVQCAVEYPPICGNNVKETCEDCDDGNVVAGDGCSPQCKKEVPAVCGNGEVEPPEECDDGNKIPGDGCDALCQSEGTCGNGVVEPGEFCDDGNNKDGDGCGAECDWEFDDPFCGDKVVEGTEWCDDGCMQGIPLICEPGVDDGDGCTWECLLEGFTPLVCGNGVVEPKNDEVCDDGNTVNGDGCNEFCKKEGIVACAPSPCCGDGNLDAGEECDDGNLDPNDKCSATCKMQGYSYISGEIKYTGQTGATDKVWIMLFDTANPILPLDPPEQEPTKPVAARNEAASFPIAYEMSVSAGTYWLVAIYDTNGDVVGGAGSGFDKLDFWDFYTVGGEKASIVVAEGEGTVGIDITLTK
jgi:cysteine-rich repeat protein